ncbi:Hypothetical predicted protein [Pelobates cultripes]|uniref:Reverse transcriptase domain-containing protein n=1 Tax=Pelobates cultripes TaxID=61616 RepID=A0AAD1SIH9_PELCU|nr:Hypothetical predicted protein [Pelobates cultripes]
MKARDSTLRVLSIQHIARRTKVPLLLLSTDVEKASDRVDWHFLMHALRSYGLGPSGRTVYVPCTTHRTHRRKTQKVAAYTDDLMFFVINLSSTVPNLLKLIETYGSLAGLKLNLSKCEVLGISQSTTHAIPRNMDNGRPPGPLPEEFSTPATQITTRSHESGVTRTFLCSAAWRLPKLTFYSGSCTYFRQIPSRSKMHYYMLPYPR